MTKQFAGCAVVIAPVVLLGAATMTGQSAAQDPWSHVPPFPTTCYSSQEFFDSATKASDALAAAIERQNEINARIEKEYHEIDMAEMAQRMQAFMLKDPQRAMEMMQAMNAAGASVTADIQRGSATAGRIQEALENHTAKFQAAVDGVRNPIQAQIKQLVDAKALPAHADAIIFATAAEEAQYLGLVARLNTEYDKMCGAWWGPSGTFQSWLKDLKTHVVDDLIASEDQIAAAKAVQFAIMETPAGGYRSTAAMTQVREYLRRAIAVDALRPNRVEVPKSAR